MIPSDKCLELIRHFEGFKAAPYLCPAKVWTIGFGSTRYADGRKVEKTDPSITIALAEEILRTTLIPYAKDVDRYVTGDLTQNQFDALVDFAYNCGSKNLLNSTLLKRVNEGKFLVASKEFGKWVFADGRKLNGLISRREAERVLFCQF